MGADLVCPNCGTPVPNGDLFGYEDPFAGTGTTVAVARRVGRLAHGFDLAATPTSLGRSVWEEGQR